MGGNAKSLMPEGWEIIPNRHNGYKYKGVKVFRIDRQRGMVELRAFHKESNEYTFGAIGLGVFETMRKLAPKIDEEYNLSSTA